MKAGDYWWLLGFINRKSMVVWWKKEEKAQRRGSTGGSHSLEKCVGSFDIVERLRGKLAVVRLSAPCCGGAYSLEQ